jgi:hypothetical protein
MYTGYNYFLPMLVRELYINKEGIIVVTTDPCIALRKNDILITITTQELFLVNALEYITDLFEDYIVINIIPITNRQSVNKSIKVNTEFKLYANAPITE